MTLRTYIRLLRPLATLPSIASCTFLAYGFGSGFHRMLNRPAAFLALGTALPLMLGIMLAGAVHEPMHRPFALLLPGNTRAFRRITVIALLVLAGFVTSAAALIDPALSPFACFGIACALLALPCLDRRLKIGGVGWALGAWIIWMGLNYYAGALVQPAILAAPWLFFFGGVGIAAAALARGFSATDRHQRAETYFIPFPHSLALLFDQRSNSRQIQQLLLNSQRRRAKPAAFGGDWTVHSVGSTTREWMQVFWHAHLGHIRSYATFAGYQLRIGATVAIAVLLAPLFFVPLMWLGNVPFHFQDYWLNLTWLTSMEPPPESQQLKSPLQLFCPMILPGIAALIGMTIVTPRWSYPLSRDRVAAIVFSLTVRQLTLALALPTVAVFSCSLLGQFISGRMQTNCGLNSIAAMTLLLIVYLPLMACAAAFRSHLARFLWSAPLGIATGAAALQRHLWTEAILSWPGIVTALLASGAAFTLLWFGLRHSYRTNDLIFSRSPLAGSMQ
jgi:hypothetical protein